MRLLKDLLIFFLILTPQMLCLAQNENSEGTQCTIEIPEVALLSLKSTTTDAIIFTLGAPEEAGLQLDFSMIQSSNIWINYSSVLPASGIQSRNLKAKISGDLPDGLQLKLLASADAGLGGGKPGYSDGEITLSETPQSIISGIGSCYTGKGINNGHCLTYTLDFNEESFSTLLENSFTCTVLFTLSDAN